MNDNQHLARRIALVGFGVALTAMVALFLYGASIASAQLMVISSTTAAAVAVSFTTGLVTINRKIKESQR